MKIIGKLGTLLFSLGLVSAGTSVQATSADMEKFSNITDTTPHYFTRKYESANFIWETFEFFEWAIW